MVFFLTGMNYNETLHWMFAQLPMYQRQGKEAFKKDLTNIKAFAKELKHPENNFKSVHVAGTNGKGSTSHMLASVLQEAGYKVGLYTSPHLKDFRERIKINGKEISKNNVIHFINKNKNFISEQGLSFFEMTVGMAFYYFAKKKVDIAIIEVGLGGRLDSTNIITPEVSVITNIGLDHTQMLGTTLPEIALEKAGIIKNKVPIIVGEYQEEIFSVFNKKAKENNTTVELANTVLEGYKTDLLGDYQQKNIKTAVKTMQVLQHKGWKINEENLHKGLRNVVSNTKLLGRWQVLGTSPKIICDTGHNTEGLTYVTKQLAKETFTKLHFVLGVVEDKNLATVLPLLPKEATYYFCKPNIPRGLSEKKLQQKCENYNLKGKSYSSVAKAYKAACYNALVTDVIFIGGSTFVVAEVV